MAVVSEPEFSVTLYLPKEVSHGLQGFDCGRSDHVETAL
jgi:hypothetical protein